ncbi:MAG TPA: 3-dehydroquinate synthase [Candidatus Omnitrophica bacterium]|nr:MAG: 3-dehydroquinate synthase [Candidatus Omnitrophota bacterium]HEC69379.1 3-dehydroquinate synthase [Candidatus Omnitrophota bacterium]
MKSLKILSLKVKAENPYSIYIGEDVSLYLDEFLNTLNLGNYGVILTNKTIFSLYQNYAQKIFKNSKRRTFTFKILPDTEKTKSLFYLTKILNELGKLTYKERVFFVCWGGGVIGDLGGFIASIYKRGSPYIQIPTTLLSQIDSSIGGKTAIDLKTGKNLVGSFWQPALVLTDISFLKTLPSSQIKEGLSEAVKYGLIKDKKLFEFIEKNHQRILEKKPLLKLIYSCVKIKKQIVEKDEREEKGIRTILNFGHTIAHGIESASNYRISHGKAVSLGIISALYISLKEGILKDKEIILRTEKVFKKIGFLLKIKIRTDKIWEAVKKDKKFIKGKTRLILLENIGKPRIKEDIKASTILEGIRKITYLPYT